MRKYQPIWEQLKAKHKATVVAPISSHATIHNMVKKERTKDLAFKLQCSESHVAYEIRAKTNIKKETLTFKLKRSYIRGGM